MRPEEAAEFCADHECEECPARDIEYRTEWQKKMLHFPCCYNLMDEEVRDYLAREMEISHGQ